MARDAQYWARKEHFERTGSWPETPNQRARREAKERDVAENGPTEEAHPVVSPQLSQAPKVESTEEPKEDHVAKVVRLWWAAHPHLRSNDNPPT
jgi:hypothetical protein